MRTRPPRSQRQLVESYRQLLNMGRAGIEALREALVATSPSLDPPDHRALLVCRHLAEPDRVEEIESILDDVIYPAYDFRRRGQITPEEAYTHLADYIRMYASDAWEESDKATWTEVADALIGLFNDDQLMREAKARFILEMRPNRVQKFRLFSEVRPVFDENGEDFEFSVTTNTLAIDFKDDGKTRTMFFSVDADDLAYLDAQLARAKRKTPAIEAAYGQSGKRILSVPTQSRDKTGEGEAVR